MTAINERPVSPELSDAAKREIAARFAAASRMNDGDAFRALCAPNAVIWHNFDDIEVTPDQTVRTVAWLHRTVPDLAWADVALHLTPTGFVSQSVMTGTAPGGPLRVHSCVIVTLGNGGLVTRVDEYMDSTETAVLRG